MLLVVLYLPVRDIETDPGSDGEVCDRVIIPGGNAGVVLIWQMRLSSAVLVLLKVWALAALWLPIPVRKPRMARGKHTLFLNDRRP